MASQITVRLAAANDARYIHNILSEIESSAKTRGTGICKRSPQQLTERMEEGNAVIALADGGEWAGFCYIKAWDDDRFVSTCALIVSPLYRNANIATQLKEKAFALARLKFPKAKLFGLTTSLAVMKINSVLGFKPVTYSEITQNEGFWQACQGCPNYGILLQKGKKNCLCTALLFEAGMDTQTSSLRQAVGVQATDETRLQKKSAPLVLAM